MNVGISPVRYECFATPVWRIPSEGRIDHEALVSAIKAEQEKDQRGTVVSNVGGWQSTMQLFQQAAFQPLAEYIREKAEIVLRDWGFDFLGHRPVMNTLWANVNRGSDVNHLHHHWGFALQNFNLLSGAYYVSCSPQCGAIKIIDERPSSKFVTDFSLPFVPKPNNFIGASFAIKPTPGDLLMFPAWLEHKVDPNEDDEARISMSFNFSLPDELVDHIHAQMRSKRPLRSGE